jgi:hypothetical protein
MGAGTAGIHIAGSRGQGAHDQRCRQRSRQCRSDFNKYASHDLSFRSLDTGSAIKDLV